MTYVSHSLPKNKSKKMAVIFSRNPLTVCVERYIIEKNKKKI